MFPRYFVLDQLLKKHKTNLDFGDYYIIAVQHLMRSTGSLFETVLRLGVKPNQIFLTGKIYSAHNETVNKIKKLGIKIKEPTLPDRLGYYSEYLMNDIQELWGELQCSLSPNAKVIILDDGGYALRSVPDCILLNNSVFGIEQTTSGYRQQNNCKQFPIIQVATSAAKTIIEPPIVSEAVRLQLGRVIRRLKTKTLGIIGFGHIGQAIAKEFSGEYQILVFDIDDSKSTSKTEKISFVPDIKDLYQASDIIIGATGTDISDLSWLTESNSDKTLISVSSGDIEFNKLIRNCTPYLLEEFTSPLQDLKLRTSNGHLLQILRGGCVANFTGKPDSSPGNIIQMTRGLLFSAILQIIRDEKKLVNLSGDCLLDPELQRDVVNLWFKDQPQRMADYSDAEKEGFRELDWIREHSKQV